MHQTLGGGEISFAADARQRQMLFIFNETKFLELDLFFIYLATLIYPECRAVPPSSVHTVIRCACFHAAASSEGVRERGNVWCWGVICVKKMLLAGSTGRYCFLLCGRRRGKTLRTCRGEWLASLDYACSILMFW